MADPSSYGNPDRDIEQALITLKKGTQLIKYSRKGKPKFRTFRLSPDETTLIWYSHGSERHLKLSSVSRIIPGQRTPVFKRFLRPEKEYLSFSLIFNNGERSLDLICKDKVESEVWLGGLKTLISSKAHNRRTRSDVSDVSVILRKSGTFMEFDGRFHGVGDISPESLPFGATLEYTASIQRSKFTSDHSSRDSYNSNGSSSSHVGSEGAIMQIRTSGADGFRLSVSSTPSCSSQGSGPDDIESLGDVYVWGEILSDGATPDGTGNSIPTKNDVLTPKPLESNVVLDVHQIACGVRHVALVTRQGEVFTWGEEFGGRLGHGIEKDFSRPRLVELLAVTNIDLVSCGEFHTCALSASGDLYTWGDGAHNVGLLGHGNDVSHWIPKRVSGPLEGLQVLSVSCGTWHSALTTSTGKLFTFGDGTFGALGHGDRESILYPKEVQSLNGLKTIGVSCGVWHTAAIIEVTNQSASSISPRKLFTWGDGDKYRLGHGNKEKYLLPTCVSALIDYNIHQIACGHDITVALMTSGHVFSMGSNAYGQLGNPQAEGKLPCLVQDKLVGEFVEQVACGDHHVAVLTSRSEVFTWGRGANGRLGHGDCDDRQVPTLVEALRDKHVRSIACGSSYTASVCIHKWVSGTDQLLCTSCRQPFGFTRKRHNCYNCGLVHCHACSSKKALKAALATTPGKPHRVCDSCYLKMKKAAELASASTFNSLAMAPRRSMDMTIRSDRGEVRTSSKVLLSPTVEPVKYLEVKSCKPGTRSDYSIVRASQVPSLLQLKDIAFPSSLSALQNALKPGITSAVPHQLPPIQPQPNSRPVSPYSRRPSPPRSVSPAFSRGVIDSLKKTNDLLTQEISKLHSQVKNLKQKSDVQDVEIEKLRKTAQEATALASDKSSQCAKAMRVVMTITDQLKEITDKLPPEISENECFKVVHSCVESFLDTIGSRASGADSALLTDSTRDQLSHSDKTALISESNSKGVREISQNVDRTPREMDRLTKDTSQSSSDSTSRTQHGPKIEGQKEVIEQFEPGVYVTLLRLPDGTKIFRRVRFSKRRFAEQQAEEWWKENKDRLMKKYSPAPPKTTSSPAEATEAQPPVEEAPQTTEENDEAAQSS